MSKEKTNKQGKKSLSEATEEKKASSRRKAIKALTAGGVVAGISIPDTWKKPIVSSMVLPAHAQTSESEEDPPAPSATVIRAEIVVGTSALLVIAESNMPASCVGATESQTLSCTLLSGATTLDANVTNTASCDPGVACLVSCSISVAAGHGVVSTDQVTMRFSLGGICVVSAVGTVA